MANYSTSRTSGDIDLESEKSDPLQLQPASSTASQVAKSVRHLLTDPRQFDILRPGPGLSEVARYRNASLAVIVMQQCAAVLFV
jgi:hypothetical protein